MNPILNLIGGRRGPSVVPTVAPLFGPIKVASQATGLSPAAIMDQFKSGRWPEHLRVKNGRTWLFDLQGIHAYLFKRPDKQETGT